ncbi:thermonuclease family protein [Bacillus sp. 165]|nr:thermonuclease family protein [Bacillus sp. 165]
MKSLRLLILLTLTMTLSTGCSVNYHNEKDSISAPVQVSQSNTQQAISLDSQSKENSSNQYYTGIPRGKVLPAVIVRVVDGDTMHINLNGKEETIRLLLVDTPETKHPSKPVQPFGPEASNLAKQTLTPGTKVEIELDSSERDKYGRLLCYLYVEGKMFNELLLEKGLARVAYVYVPNTRYVDQFYSIQQQAQTRKKGIWSIENYATENGFNPEAAQNSSSSPSVPSSECNIKGNISSKGEKIYHMPNQQFYNITKPEEMFCSRAEAEAAGYRPSMK